MIADYLKKKINILFFCVLFASIASVMHIPFSYNVKNSVIKEAENIKLKMIAILANHAAIDIKDVDISFVFKKFSREYSYTTKERTGRYVYKIINADTHQEFIVNWREEGKDITIISIYTMRNGKNIEVYKK
jgi:hypothetical protein